jgi:hypothetical protein
MSKITATMARETIQALAPAARAFTKAQSKGHVWIGQDGLFETIESTGMYQPADPKNPDQLRLV